MDQPKDTTFHQKGKHFSKKIISISVNFGKPVLYI